MPTDLTTRADGTVEMAYTSKKPWHGLGVEVDHPMTSAEAIELAGLDWEVAARPAYVINKGKQTRIPGKQAIQRMDNLEVFDISSTRYKPVQNHEAFTFFDGVVGAGEAVYETAGSLRGGRKVWILAKLPGDLNIGDGDLLQKYILLANSHDRSMPMTMKITPIRVVCNNTLELSLTHQGGRQVKFRHTANILNKMNNTREFLGLVDAHFELFMQQVNRMVDLQFTEGDVREVAAAAIELDLDSNDQSKAKVAVVDRISELFYTGQGSNLLTASGTGWGAFNAVTEFVDHEWAVNGSKNKESNALAVTDRRLNSSWFGSGQGVRQRAWDKVLQLA